MHIVQILPNGLTIRAKHNAVLLDVLRAHQLAPETPCGGHGTCGKCRVIADGKTVLACRTLVDRDMTVILSPPSEETRILTGGLEIRGRWDPFRSGPLIAVDIGTTTVVCYLLEEGSGRELATASMLNPQSPYGADVISRIQHALGGAAENLTKAIRTGVAELIDRVCREGGVTPDQVGVVALVGNPCMQQMFLGISVENLASIPFSPVLTHSAAQPAADFLPRCSRALLLTVPDVSGYIGGDTMGCILSTNLFQETPLTLMVDIGTNGEMVLGNRDGMAACSTAAGPALEGANITFGMRGMAGAIDHVWTEEGRIRCSVIGGGPAKGICGSGVIDAVAVLVELGLVNQRGRLLTENEQNGERIVPLTDTVYLTQNDIREVQMAKGAIAAGIELMVRDRGVDLAAIDRVLLAGAFGSFIRPSSACRIGLLPPALLDRIQAVGNAAGSGAKLLARDRSTLPLTDALLERIRFLELADLPDFRSVFARNMRLPNHITVEK